MQYSRLLKRWLDTKQLTPTEAAPLFGVRFQTLYRWLAGDLPPDSKLPLLASVLGVPEAKLRRTIERERAKREAEHGADGVAQPETATATTAVGVDAEPQS